MKLLVPFIAWFALVDVLAAETALRMQPTVLARMFKESEESAPKEDGLWIRVCVYNDGDSEAVLPSQMMELEITETDEHVSVIYKFAPYTMLSKPKKYTIIPSRESFHPVVLKPGECMLTDMVHRPVPHGGILSKPVRVTFITRGFLAERLGFTAVELSGETKASVGTHSPKEPLL